MGKPEYQYQCKTDEMDNDDDAVGNGTTKTTQSSTSNCIERCLDGKADGGERGSTDIVDNVGDEYRKDNDAASPRSGRRNEEPGDAGKNNKDDDNSKRESNVCIVATIREVDEEQRQCGCSRP